MITLAARFWAIRVQRRMTQEQLAAKAQVDLSEIENIESGANKSPHLGILYALAEAMDTTIGDLLGIVTEARFIR